MSTLLKSHHYVNRNPKTNRYVNHIIPQDDREVPQRLFDCFEDVTTTPAIRLDDSQNGVVWNSLEMSEAQLNFCAGVVLRNILQTTGAEQ